MNVVTSHHSFSSAYQQLNLEQRQAVDAIDGPVMVMAGPGTGKTQVLAVRIAHILQQTDTPPQAILALTFTESAAANMRQRLIALIGNAGYYVQITTFHSFCSSVIQHHPEFFPLNRGGQPLSEVERYQLFEQLLGRADLTALRPLNRPLFYIREVMRSVSDLKREGVSVADFAKLVEAEAELLEKNGEQMTKAQRQRRAALVAKWRELHQLYGAYEETLREWLRYDFDDMIMLVAQAFANHEELLLEYQERLHYFLIDEYQDTNSAQNKVVSLLASYWGEQANVFVVGDPYQAIYRFQGASAENALTFMQQYPDAVVINLQTGYRCPQSIYDIAYGLIAGGEAAGPEPVRLESIRGIGEEQTGAPVSLLEAPTQVLEATLIAERVRQLVESGVALDEIGILFRHNRDAELLQDALDAQGIHYHLDTGNDILRHELTRQILVLLHVLVELQQGIESHLLYEVLQYEWMGLPSVVPIKLAWVAQKTKQSVLGVIEGGWDKANTVLKDHPVTQIEFAAAEQVVQLLRSWIKADSNQLLLATLEQMFDQSGLLKWAEAHIKKVEYLTLISTLFEHVRSLMHQNRALKLAGLVQHMNTMLTHGITLSWQDITAGDAAVTLTTAHRAKGREWDYVFIAHAIDGKWGNPRTRNILPLPETILQFQPLLDEQVQLNEDDRRLFYVSLTRAAKQVVVSYPRTLISEGREQKVTPSMFVSTMMTSGSEPLPVTKPELTPDELAAQTRALLTPADVTHHLLGEQRAFLQFLVSSLKLSVTALNTYLRDPQQFFEEVILRVPRVKPEPVAFGTAMHSALEFMGKEMITQQAKPELGSVMRRFESALRQELLTDEELTRRLSRGRELLAEYYQQVEINPVDILYIERFFGSGASSVFLDDIALTGRIDRVDWIDKVTHQVRVVDYKTGKPKSANHVEGLVASQDLSERERSLPEPIRGPMKRQLLFYKLLADLDPTFLPKVTRGTFSFIEPSPSGKIVERDFDLLDADVELLKELIKEVMNKVRSLTFLQSVV